MKNSFENFDHGREFDWGLASETYAEYRNGGDYPELMWKKILDNLPPEGSGTVRLLDLGTGTGIVPRRLAQRRSGLDITGIDCEPGQIAAARKMCEKENISGIKFFVGKAEELDRLEADSFDAVTACQCFCYFDRAAVGRQLARVMKKGARLILMFVSWLPHESDIAAASERLVLKYNPQWTGGGHTACPIFGAEDITAEGNFRLLENGFERFMVPYTAEKWNGRMCACRAILPSLPPEQCEAFSAEHLAMLWETAGESFMIPHSLAAAVLERV